MCQSATEVVCCLPREKNKLQCKKITTFWSGCRCSVSLLPEGWRHCGEPRERGFFLQQRSRRTLTTPNGPTLPRSIKATILFFFCLFVFSTVLTLPLPCPFPPKEKKQQTWGSLEVYVLSYCLDFFFFLTDCFHLTLLFDTKIQNILHKMVRSGPFQWETLWLHHFS